MKIAKITIEDEVNIKVSGLDLPERRKCVNALKYFIPGARYSAAFKLGRWDGTKSFMTVGGRTYLNLLDQILPIIQEAEYEVELEDLRPPFDFSFDAITEEFHQGKAWPVNHRFEGQPIVLRDYQVEIVNSFIENPQSIYVASTGSGKTIVTATLSSIVEPYGRSIVIVPNKSLVEQTEKDYINLGLDVGVLYGDRKEYNKTHTICTWQSLSVLDQKSKDCLDQGQLEIFMNNLVCVICDECFDGDSKVLTPMGYIPIKEIKAGDKVINYSESDKVFKEDVVVKQHKNLNKSESEKMYELEFDIGNKIRVTGNHEFLTTVGWVRADNLTEEHEIINKT